MILWQAVCFGLLVALVWATEVFDLPSRLAGQAPSPADWGRAGLLSVGAILTGAAVLYPCRRRTRVEGFKGVTVCSYCHKVHGDDDWEHFEVFFSRHMGSNLSHGVCPDCCARVMQDYRSGKRNAGARETIMVETLV